jgi:hypothetical protein
MSANEKYIEKMRIVKQKMAKDKMHGDHLTDVKIGVYRNSFGRLDKFFQGQAQKVDLPLAFPASTKLNMILNDFNEIKKFQTSIDKSIPNSVEAYMMTPDQLASASKNAFNVQGKGIAASKSFVAKSVAGWTGELQQKILNTKHNFLISTGKGLQESLSAITSGKASADTISDALKGNFSVSGIYTEGILKEAGLTAKESR